jgi:hypothetical protein
MAEWYELRHAPRGRGLFQDERIGWAGPFWPLGSFAAQKLWEYGPTRDRAAEGGIRVHAASPPEVVAQAWWIALEYRVRHARMPAEVWDRISAPFPAAIAPPRRTAEGLVLAVYLEENVESALIALSAELGLAERRLWLCVCGRPFVRALDESNRRTCKACGRLASPPAAGLPPALAVRWHRLQKRVWARVSRHVITAADGTALLRAAGRSLRDVAYGRRGLEAWAAEHDGRDPRGRRPKGSQ